jgi:uncharacterized membrane protein YccC
VALTSVTSAEGRRWQWLTRAPGFLLQSVHDPGHTSLRRGLRAGLVVPLLLASAMVAHVGAAFSTFLVFGAMALLVFADFGGQARPRVLAYLLTALAGIPLIVIGTLASNSVVVAVCFTAIVAFMLSGMGVLGGYFLSSQTALMLAFVLAVSSAAGLDVLPDRVLGWATAGVVSVLAGLLIWPRSGHVALRVKAASVVRTVAAAVAAPDQSTPRLAQAARDELATLQRGFVVAQRRPSGATRRDRALAELATELDRALTYVTSVSAATDSANALPEAVALRASVVRALNASANLLEGGRDAHDIDSLIAIRDTHRSALDRWAGQQLQGGAAPASVLDGLVAAHPLRVMSMVALAIAQNAEVAAGLPSDGLQHASRRGIWNTFLEELTPSSVWLQNSLRTALGVAVAVLVARSLALPYAFWVVLGTLSALRSNVSATGRSALQALGGTMLGVLIAVPFVGATGHEPWVLWVVLPILVFLAAYTPAAVHFVVGQAAFSVLVVVLFNILAPTDWEIGVVRVENAALGVAVSAVVGLLLWPRGARGQLRSALAALYEAGASTLSFSFRRMLGEADSTSQSDSNFDSGGVEDRQRAKDLAHTQAIRAQEVFEQFLNERSRQSPAISVWATLLSSGKGFLLIDDVVDSMVDHGYGAGSVGAPAIVCGTFAGEAVASIVRMAEEIRSGHALRVTEPRDVSEELRGASLTALSAPGLGASTEALRAASGLVFFSDWLGQLDVLLHELESPVAETLAASRLPWWR